jgi:proteasome lid subunit RPN8/RPN11/TusA-related sulfurtransferase
MLTIAKNTLNALLDHARRALPIEACGYLAERNGIVVRHYELANIDYSSTHFTLDPAEQFEALRDMRGRGLKLRAVYHSHPGTPARLSAEDLRLAVDPSISYVVVSLAQADPQLAAFRVIDKTAREEDLGIVDDPVPPGTVHSLDITKDVCPMTFVKVKVKLAKIAPGDRLEVLLGEGEPLKNVPRSAQEQGYRVLSVTSEGPYFKVIIEK